MQIYIKKILNLVLFSFMLLGLVACGNSNNNIQVNVNPTIDTNTGDNSGGATDPNNGGTGETGDTGGAQPTEGDMPTIAEPIQWIEVASSSYSPCANQSPSNATKSKIYLDVQGLDAEAGSKFSVQPFVNQGGYAAFPANTIEKNGCIAVKDLSKSGWPDLEIYNSGTSGGDFKLTLENAGKTSINQVCKIVEYIPNDSHMVNFQTGLVKMYYSNYQNPVVKIDCKTQVSITNLVDTAQTQIVDVKDKNIRLFNIKMQGPQGAINSNSLGFEYATSSYNLVSLTENGLVSFNNSGLLKVKIKPNPSYYTSNKEFIYTFWAKDRDLIYQNIEMGQSVVLPVGSEYQVVVPNNKTLVRALVYGKNADTPISNNANLTIKNGSYTTTVNLTCPQHAKQGEFDNYHYVLEDTCYAVLDAYNSNSLKQNAVFEFSVNGQKKVIMPRVYPERSINIKIFKGNNSNGIATLPNASDIEKYLKQIYPFSVVNIIPSSEVNLSTVLSTALNTLTEKQKNAGDRGKYHYYGFVPQASCFGQIGLGWVGQPSAVGINTNCASAVEETMMHELGHNLSLNHGPCQSFGTGLPEGIDNFWYTNPWSGANEADLSGAPIFIQDTDSVVSPFVGYAYNQRNYKKDLMSYCRGTRINKHSYKQVADFTQGKGNLYPLASVVRASSSVQPLALGMQRAETKPEYKFNLSGEILEDKILLNDLQIYPGKVSNDYMHGSMGYTVVVKTEDINFAYPLPIRRLDHSPRQFFDLDLPYFSKIESIKFMQGETKLAYEFKEPEIIVSSEEKIAPAKNLTQLIDYKNQTIYWQDSKYKYMKVVYIAPDNNREVLKLVATGGAYKLPTRNGIDYKSGKLEVVLFEGLNTYMQIIDLH